MHLGTGDSSERSTISSIHEKAPPVPLQAIRLMFFVTTGQTAAVLMKGQLRYLASRGYDITVVAAAGEHLAQVAAREGVKIVGLPMSREITPFRDLWVLWRLWRVMRAIRPQVVNASTPKAGLLGMLAAFLARVPIRIYTLRGLRLETTQGLKRRVLALAERVCSACAHRVLSTSDSLAKEYAELELAAPGKMKVLGGGSSNGVNASGFERTADRVARATQIRKAAGIGAEDPVIGFVGRMVRDKGMPELVRAFELLIQEVPNAWLLLVGGVEGADVLDEATLETIQSHPRIVLTGFVGDVAAYYAAMNVLAFPSFREGFPNAVLEAQASGLPVVGFRATGVKDAVVDGKSGRLVPIGAVEEFAQALVEYVRNPQLAAKHGEFGRHRVRSEFSNERVWNALLGEYTELIHAAGFALPATLPAPTLETHAA